MSRWWRGAAAAGLGLTLLTGLAVGLAADPAAADDPTSPSTASSASASDQTTLRVAVSSEIANPNIWAVNSVSEWEAITMEYDLLMGFSPEDLTAAPGLADSCTPSDGNRTWTCKIQPGMKWSDGQPITSKDVAFTYRLVQDKGFGYFKTYIPDGSTFETPDDQTLVWHTPKPSNAPMIPAWVYIVPEHVWGKYADDSVKDIKAVDALPVVGSGPYVMTDAVEGQRWTFERNPYFRGDPPAYDRIVFQYYDNQEAMVQALKSGEVDIIDGVDAPLLPSLQGHDNITVQKVAPDCWISMPFNFGGQSPDAKPLPALQDVQVRRAIEMAIDKQGIIDKVYPGAAQPGETVIRPLSRFWHLDIPDDKLIPYDPDQANQILDAAGYTRGSDGIRVDPKTGDPLVINLPTSGDTQGSEAAGRLVAGYLKQVGIKVNVQPVTAGKMYDIQQNGTYDAYIWYWCGDPDPNYQLSVFSTSQTGKAGDGHLSDGNWSDPHYDALYEKQRTTLDQAARKKLVDEAQQYVYDQVPVVVLAYTNYLQAYRNDLVTDLTPIPAGVGYITPNYSYLPFEDARPVESTSTAAGGGSDSTGVPMWVWLAVVAVAAFLIGRWSRRGHNAYDTEEG